MDRRAFLKKAVTATRVAGITPIAGAGVLDAVPNTAFGKIFKNENNENSSINRKSPP